MNLKVGDRVNDKEIPRTHGTVVKCTRVSVDIQFLNYGHTIKYYYNEKRADYHNPFPVSDLTLLSPLAKALL